MFKLNYLFIGLLFFAACANDTSSNATTEATPEVEEKPASIEQPVITTEEYCYLSTFGENPNQQDSTFVNLVIVGDVVTGDLHWHPYEKDGGHGTLRGERMDDLISVRYDYMIEGSKQAEQMIFRMDEDKLVKKVGELIENEDGVLVMKDSNAAEFKDEIPMVECTGRKLL